jgi:ATP-binding cassette subfamily F protein 3
MDEPTNHLDMPSVEALESALDKYKGTLLMISHDRYFLDKLVHRVAEVKDRHLDEYTGNYSYYLEKRNIESENRTQAKETPPQQISGRKTKDQKRIEAEARQAVSKRRNRLQIEVDSLELKINTLEAKKIEMEQSLAKPETYKDSSSSVALQKDYTSVKKELEKSYKNWESFKLELEELLDQLP